MRAMQIRPGTKGCSGRMRHFNEAIVTRLRGLRRSCRLTRGTSICEVGNETNGTDSNVTVTFQLDETTPFPVDMEQDEMCPRAPANNLPDQTANDRKAGLSIQVSCIVNLSNAGSDHSKQQSAGFAEVPAVRIRSVSQLCYM